MNTTLREGDARHIRSVTEIRDAHHTPLLLATRIGGHAYCYLRSERRCGRVVSAFGHGFGVLFGGDSAPTHVTVQGSAAAFHPWAIEVAAPPRAEPGSAAMSAEGRLRLFAPECDLAVEGSTIDELHFPLYDRDEAATALSRIKFLQTRVTARRAEGRDPFQSDIDAALEQWRATGDPVVLTRLVGLGGGSTPLGDDCLVGLAAGLHALAAVSERAAQCLEALRGQLEEAEDPLSWTIPASREAMGAALEGCGPEALCALLRSLGHHHMLDSAIGRPIERVVALGATSGVGMMEGLCSALRVSG